MAFIPAYIRMPPTSTVLDVMRTMVLNNTPLVIIEGERPKFISAKKVLKLISCNIRQGVVGFLNILNMKVKELADECWISNNEREAAVAMLDRECVISTSNKLYKPKDFLGMELKREYMKLKVERIVKRLFIEPFSSLDESMPFISCLGDGYAVISYGGKYMGVITPLTLVKYFSSEESIATAERGDPSLFGKAVGDLMVRVEPVNKDLEVEELLKIMKENELDIVPVVRERNIAVGYVTYDSILFLSVLNNFST